MTGTGIDENSLWFSSIVPFRQLPSVIFIVVIFSLTPDIHRAGLTTRPLDWPYPSSSLVRLSITI